MYFEVDRLPKACYTLPKIGIGYGNEFQVTKIRKNKTKEMTVEKEKAIAEALMF